MVSLDFGRIRKKSIIFKTLNDTRQTDVNYDVNPINGAFLMWVVSAGNHPPIKVNDGSFVYELFYNHIIAIMSILI